MDWRWRRETGSVRRRVCGPRRSAGSRMPPGNAQQRYRIEIEHRLGVRMVALADVVAGEAKNIAHAQSGRAQNVALQRDAVAVAAGELRHRRQSVGDQDGGGGSARHMAIRAGAVGDVDGVDQDRGSGRRVRSARRDRLESGGETSTVTTKRPDLHACSKLKLSRAGASRRPDGGRLRMRAIDHAQP